MILVIPALPLIIVIAVVRARERPLADGRGDRVHGWAASARVLRAQTLSVRNREYVLAAKAG